MQDCLRLPKKAHHLLFHNNLKKNVGIGEKTVGRALAFHAAKRGSTPYDPQAMSGVIFEHRARSNP